MLFNPFADLCSIQLTIIGISFSIFTIFYSLSLGKLEVLNSISNQIKQGNHSPELMQSEHFCLKTINRLKRMCFWSIVVCLVSILLTVLMWIFRSFNIPAWLYNLLCFINILDFICVLTLIIIVFISYFKDSKFD